MQHLRVVPSVNNVRIQTVVFLVTQCSLVGRYQHFRRTCCLHLQGW